MESVTFETATLADAISKAQRIAPIKGAAFDRAAGIRIEYQPPYLLVKATDLDITYVQQVNHLEAGDEPFQWRLPAVLLSGVVANLPLGEGVTAKLEKDDASVRITCGRSKTRIRRIEGDYPEFGPFSEDDLVAIPSFSQRLNSVSWACDRNSGSVLSGVYLDGEHIYATNRSAAVRMPCESPVDKPVAVPLAPLASLMKNTAEVRVGARDDKLLIVPESGTQATSRIFVETYAPVALLFDMDRYGFVDSFLIAREQLEQALVRMMVIGKAERYPLVRLTIKAGELHIYTEEPESGAMEEILDITSGGTFASTWFTPTFLLDALRGCPFDKVDIHYSDNPNKPFAIKVSDYEAVVMPRMVGT